MHRRTGCTIIDTAFLKMKTKYRIPSIEYDALSRFRQNALHPCQCENRRHLSALCRAPVAVIALTPDGGASARPISSRYQEPPRECVAYHSQKAMNNTLSSYPAALAEDRLQTVPTGRAMRAAHSPERRFTVSHRLGAT